MIRTCERHLGRASITMVLALYGHSLLKTLQMYSGDSRTRSSWGPHVYAMRPCVDLSNGLIN